MFTKQVIDNLPALTVFTLILAVNFFSTGLYFRHTDTEKQMGYFKVRTYVCDVRDLTGG